jgi:hypothetical protein
MRACGEALQMVGRVGIVQEDLVHDEREVMPTADIFEPFAFRAPGGMAGGVIGVNEENGTGSRGDALLESREVDPPAVVIEEGIGLEVDVLEIGEVVEEGIAGLGNEDLVAGIAEEAEEVSVGLAGAGGQGDVARID